MKSSIVITKSYLKVRITQLTGTAVIQSVLFFIILTCLLSCTNNKEKAKELDLVSAPGTLLINDSSATQGFVLFAPQATDTVYLINKNDATVCNYWTDGDPKHLGLNAYLLADGRLLHSQNVRGSKGSGDPGGRIVMTSWDNKTIWSCTINSDTLQQSHDIYPMPGGNVLVATWELIPWDKVARKSPNRACLKDSSLQKDSLGMWSAKILELAQDGDSATIKWKWRLWDHLVTNPDSVSANPQLMDVNYMGSPNGSYKDWIHMNAIAYNPALEQIMFSSRNLNELYIIEHTKDRCKSSAHKGGKYGKGGDFLYRWGNPAAYKMGATSPQQFFGQHSPYWLDTSSAGSNKIMINNDGFKGHYDFSECKPMSNPIATAFNIIETPYDPTTKSYGIAPNQVLKPVSPIWSDTVPSGNTNPREYWNEFEGNVQLLPNGNLIACAARNGILYELNTGSHRNDSNKVVWRFDMESNQGGAFRCYQYTPKYVQNIIDLHNSKNQKERTEL